jgi:hypothetical protein
MRYATFKQLKAFIVAARAQSLPAKASDAPTLFSQTTEVLDPLLHSFSSIATNLAPVELEYKIRLLVECPTVCGIIINMAQSISPTEEEVDEIARDSLLAEVMVNNLERRAPVCNWNAVFDPECVSEPLLTTSRPCPITNANIHNRLVVFRSSIAYSTLFPHASRKGVSSETVSNYYQVCEEVGEVPSDGHISPKALLSLYLRTGATVDGRCELKQKWYPTGLKPRSYYNQGGSAYFASMYLRNFFNTLADLFPYTNRLKRVDISRLRFADPDSRFIVYDFSNFTSNFSEQYYFLRALANFFRHTVVFLVGPLLERTPVDIGDLIDAYTDIVNDRPEYYVGDNIISSLRIPVPLAQLQAGFLGVYGNLMTCTVPHGLSARQHVRYDNQLSTAGDDGLAVDPDDMRNLEETLHQLGDYAAEKCYFSETGVYLKLPLVKLVATFMTSFRIMHPNLNLTGCEKISDIRFGHLASLAPGELRFKIYFQLIEYIRAVMSVSKKVVIEDWEAGILESIFNDVRAWSRLGAQHVLDSDDVLSFGKTLPRKVPLPDVGWRDIVARNWQSYPFHSDCRPKTRSRRRGVSPFPIEDVPLRGDLFYCNSSSLVKLLEAGEWIRKVDDSDIDESFDCVLVEFEGRFMDEGPELYLYEAVDEIDDIVLQSYIEHKPELKRMIPDEFVSFSEESPEYKRRKLEVGIGRYVPDWDDPMQFGPRVDYIEYDENVEADREYMSEEEDVDEKADRFAVGFMEDPSFDFE